MTDSGEPYIPDEIRVFGRLMAIEWLLDIVVATKIRGSIDPTSETEKLVELSSNYKKAIQLSLAASDTKDRNAVLLALATMDALDARILGVGAYFAPDAQEG